MGLKELWDRLHYKWVMTRWRVMTRIHHWHFMLTNFVCWHITEGGVFKRCVRCYLKKEMYDMLNEEIERVILYGDGS